MPRPTLADARVALRAHFGYDDFRSPQIGALEAVLSGRDALIVLPTGGGKSMCFQIPALLLPGLTVVVSPLISLMSDQVHSLQRRGIAAEYINSTLPQSQATARIARLRRAELKLLYVAPERLVIGGMIDVLRQLPISLLAIDEAHCVSQWGHDFRPSYLRLRDVRRSLGMPQTVALTATATPLVRNDIRRLLDLRQPAEVLGGFDRPNLRFSVERVRNETARRDSAVRLLAGGRGPAVVYVPTRRQVDRVLRLLARQRVAAVGYHAGLPAERRASAQETFMRDEIPIIVATNAFGMGIDKRDVRLVLHYAISGSLEDYYQEAGRAGRDGSSARCVLLFHPHDRVLHDRFQAASYPTPSVVRHVYNALEREQRRAQPLLLDARRLSAADRGRVDPATAERGIEFLEQNGLLRLTNAPGAIRVRPLATPLRIVCEQQALSALARQVLGFASETPDGALWIDLAAARIPLRRFDLRRALDELEARQLVCVETPPVRACLWTGCDAKRRLSRALSMLRSRRKDERAKLDGMVGYATASSCRRAFILRYFRDPSARPRCGRCDNCNV